MWKIDSGMRSFQEYVVLREAMDDIVVGNIVVPRRELIIRFDASGGAGGQNVNKLATKATLKWPVASSVAWVGHEEILHRFLSMFANRINREGDLVIQSQQERKQRQNLNAAIAKLADLIAQAADIPMQRIDTRPTQGSVERRIRDKDKMRLKKSQRSGGWQNDWS